MCGSDSIKFALVRQIATKVGLDPPATHSICSYTQYEPCLFDPKLISWKTKFWAQKGNYPPGAKKVLKVTFFEKKFVVNGATEFFPEILRFLGKQI